MATRSMKGIGIKVIIMEKAGFFLKMGQTKQVFGSME